jgi:ABC-type lipopolysaccharide export system ATPase subunit
VLRGAEVGVEDAVVGPDLGGRAAGQQAADVEDVDPVTDRHPERHVVLDELSMGLAPMVVEGLYEEVAKIAADGVAVLVVEQFARVALRVADRAAVMVGGRVVVTGSPDELEGSLAEVYLGGNG